MSCKACKSETLQKLEGELTVSQPSLKALRVSPVYVCGSIVVCLACGFTELVIPARELQLLKKGQSAAGA